MGVNLIDWFLITNTQESPDVDQRDGRSKNTDAPVGFAAGRNSSKAPAAYTTDVYHLAATISLCVIQEFSGAGICRSSVFHRLLWANLQVGYLPHHLQWWGVHLKGVFLALKRAQSQAETLQGARYQLRAHLTQDASHLEAALKDKPHAKTGGDTRTSVDFPPHMRDCRPMNKKGIGVSPQQVMLCFSLQSPKVTLTSKDTANIK